METDYNNLINLIMTTPELALIPLALLIGKFVKESKIPDEFIPIVVMVATALIGFLITGMDVAAAIKGFAAGLIASGGIGALRQLNKKTSKKSTKASKKDVAGK
jgi:hypothetical protein